MIAISILKNMYYCMHAQEKEQCIVHMGYTSMLSAFFSSFTGDGSGLSTATSIAIAIAESNQSDS